MVDDFEDGISDDFSGWRNLIDLLYEGGMTDDPEVLMACTWFIETNGDSEMLEELLNERPDMLTMARRNRMVDIKAKKENPFHPEPLGGEVEELKGEIGIGDINGMGDTVGLNPIDFTRGFFVCGEIGSGKSYPVFRMLDQILSIPKEDRGFNVIIAQTLKNDANFLLRDHSNLKILDWENIRYAPLYVEPWDKLDKKINSFFDVFKSVNWLMLFSQPLLERAIKLAFSKYGENNVNFSRIVGEVHNAATSLNLVGHRFKDVIDHVLFSLTNCTSKGDFLDSYKGYPIEEFFTQEDLILNLDDLSSDYVVATFLGCLFKDIQRFYNTKAQATNLRTLLVIDECRRVFPSAETHSQTGHNPNSAMMNFITTRRSSGIGLIAVTQEIKSVPSWLTANSAYVLAMPISGEPRDDVKKLLNLNDEESSYIDKLPALGVGIMRYRGFDRRFIVDVPSDLDDTPMDENVIKVMMEEYIGHIQTKYLIEPLEIKEFEEVEKGSKEYVIINPIDLEAEEKQAMDKVKSILLIKELAKNPFKSFTELRTITGLSANRMKDSTKLLLAQGLADEIVCIGAKKKKARYIVLTDKVPGRNLKNPFFFKHTLYEFRVMNCLKANGYENVEMEYFGEKKKGFKPSSITIKTKDGEQRSFLKRIDVYGEKEGKRIGYEITISFSNLLDNIHKCLEIFKVDELHIVAEDTKGRDKAMQIIGSKVPPHLVHRINCNLISDFCMKGNV